MATRARTERRAAARQADKLARDAERAWLAGPGASPARALHVESASGVEPRARNLACPRCHSALGTVDHRAETIAGERLRVVGVRCASCRWTGTTYFRVGAARLDS